MANKKKESEVAQPLSAWRDVAPICKTAAPWHVSALAGLATKAKSDRLPTGLLLVGPAGVGKTVFVREFVKQTFCQASQSDKSCGSCSNCQQIEAGIHRDLVLLSPEAGKRSISVDAIREFSRRLHLTGAPGSMRIGVIDPAEALTTSAANALLKTLEEPPAGVTIILLCERSSVLPATIRSRCQLLRLPAPGADDAAEWLIQQGAGTDRAVVQQLLTLNGPFDLLQMLGGIPGEAEASDAFSPQVLDKELARLGNPTLDCVAMASYWKAQGLELRLRWLFLSALAELRRRHTGDTEKESGVLSRLSLTSLRDLPKSCIQMLRELSTQQNPQLLAESFLIRLHRDVMIGMPQ